MPFPALTGDWASGHIRLETWADQSGSNDIRGALAQAAAIVSAQDQVRRRRWYIDGRGGTWRVDWDHATGYGGGIPAVTPTTYNARCCVLFQNAEIVFDFTGATILHGGASEADWATVFRLRHCAVSVLGGTYDYVNLPFFQGTVTARGADWLDVTLDPGTAPPSFATAYRVHPYDAQRRPTAAGVGRSPGQPYSLSDRGNGVWRVSGFSLAEMSAFGMTTYIPNGTTVTVTGMEDGPQWFRFDGCSRVRLRDCTVNACVDSFATGHLIKNLDARGCVAEPRPGYLVSCHRALLNFFSVGRTNVLENTASYTLDDCFAIQGTSLARYSGATYPMERLSSTSFNAFGNFHFMHLSLPVGTRLSVFEGDYQWRCECTVTGVADIAGSWMKTYTVSIQSGALPLVMADCLAIVRDYQARGAIEGNATENIRGRSIFTSIIGSVSRNRTMNNSDEAILHETSRTNWENSFQDADGLMVCDNQVRNPCLNPFYPAGIVVRAANMLGVTSAPFVLPNAATSGATPKRNVAVRGNLVTGAQNMALMIGGVRHFVATDNIFDDIAANGSVSDAFDALDAAVVGIDSSAQGVVGRNRMTNIHGAAPVKQVGVNSDITLIPDYA